MTGYAVTVEVTLTNHGDDWWEVRFRTPHATRTLTAVDGKSSFLHALRKLALADGVALKDEATIRRELADAGIATLAAGMRDDDPRVRFAAVKAVIHLSRERDA